jgi:hypothetical protein
VVDVGHGPVEGRPDRDDLAGQGRAWASQKVQSRNVALLALQGVGRPDSGRPARWAAVELAGDRLTTVGAGRSTGKQGKHRTRRSHPATFGVAEDGAHGDAPPHRADYRSDLKAARISSENSSGSSQAAKWPPLSASLK